jgi:hypothetical protein
LGPSRVEKEKRGEGGVCGLFKGGSGLGNGLGFEAGARSDGSGGSRARAGVSARKKEALMSGLHSSVGGRRRAAYPFRIVRGWAMGQIWSWAGFGPAASYSFFLFFFFSFLFFLFVS